MRNYVIAFAVTLHIFFIYCYNSNFINLLNLKEWHSFKYFPVSMTFIYFFRYFPAPISSIINLRDAFTNLHVKRDRQAGQTLYTPKISVRSEGVEDKFCVSIHYLSLSHVDSVHNKLVTRLPIRHPAIGTCRHLLSNCNLHRSTCICEF